MLVFVTSGVFEVGSDCESASTSEDVRKHVRFRPVGSNGRHEALVRTVAVVHCYVDVRSGGHVYRELNRLVAEEQLEYIQSTI